MLPMTCDEGYFHEADAGFESSGEASVRQPATGAIASWSPTGYGLSAGHDYLEKGLFLALFHNNVSSLGAATTAAKLYLSANAPPGRYADLIDTFLLLGDAGLRVQLVDTGPGQLYLPLISR